MNQKTVISWAEAEKINQPLLITQSTRGVTTAGAPYMSLVVQDKTGSMEGKLWDVKEEQAALAEPGKIVTIVGEVLKYRNSLQLRIHNVLPVNGDFDPTAFVNVSKYSKEYLKGKIDAAIHSIQDEIYYGISKMCIERYEKEFYEYPAASKNHHDFLGGLATHVVAMIDLADEVCKRYEILNRDLLIAGILTHDLGKIIELSGPVLTEYTMQGKLLGHISMMQSIVYELALTKNWQDSEQITCLRHMILSHHGQYEYGSPVLPMVAEAEVLHLIDNLDARLNMFEKMFEITDVGQFSGRIFSLENRSFYRTK
jgi:3'-5' exoribonuclease